MHMDSAHRRARTEESPQGVVRLEDGFFKVSRKYGHPPMPSHLIATALGLGFGDDARPLLARPVAFRV